MDEIIIYSTVAIGLLVIIIFLYIFQKKAPQRLAEPEQEQDENRTSVEATPPRVLQPNEALAGRNRAVANRNARARMRVAQALQKAYLDLTGYCTAKMIRTAVLGVLVLLSHVLAAPDYGGGFIHVAPAAPPAPSYGTPPAPSYGPPKEDKCYPKFITKTMVKDVQDTENHYATVTAMAPTTNYAYITETLVAPKTIIQYSTMTAYAEPQILTETKILYDTKIVTVPIYMTESTYGYNTANMYFTETEGVYATKTVTQSYPMTQTITKTGYETKGFYVTQTKVQNSYATVTVKNPYYQTKYATEYKENYVYNTVKKTVNSYVTMTVYNTVPEYHTVTKCAPKTMMYGYP